MKDASGVYTFTYDPLNRVETVTNPADKTIQYTYDPVGNRAAMLDPDGGRFTYSYDAAGRVASIVDDDTTHLTDYSSLGQGTVVIADRPQPEVKFTLVDLNENNHPETGDIYSGLDRFGGVKDNRWHNYDQNEDVDRIQHGYDCAGNRLWRENVVAAQQNKDFDELYLYDGLHRLVDIQRGRLNAQKDGIQSGTLAFAQTWQLDETGNWPNFKEDEDGSQSWDLDQGRTHNPVNEITAITAATGTDWADPAHDRNGNMTTIPKPANLADGLTASYDAWNRLVEVKDGEAVIARYEYDGLNRRIKSHLDSGAPSNPSGIDTYLHYYYNSTWQILETRQSDTQSAQPETLQPKHQYVWSQRYIDAPVLRDENTGTNGLCDDQRLYYLNDANFNVTALLDTVGDAVERYVYSPYGVVTIYDPTWTNTRSASSHANVTLYTGRELDGETGLYYYRNRYYTAELGRFVSRDPVRYERADTSIYRYCGNNPTTHTDPFGELRNPHIPDVGGQIGGGGGVPLRPGLIRPWHPPGSSGPPPSQPTPSPVRPTPPPTYTPPYMPPASPGPGGPVQPWPGESRPAPTHPAPAPDMLPWPYNIHHDVFCPGDAPTDAESGRRRGKYRCSTKARDWAVGTECYDRIFVTEGADYTLTKRASWDACVEAGCHQPGRGGDCGHTICHRRT